jgi:hypothetical protein
MSEINLQDIPLKIEDAQNKIQRLTNLRELRVGSGNEVF